MKNTFSKRKIALAIVAILLMTSTMLMEMPANGQYTNMQDSGSIAVPANVTPDESYTTVAHLSFRPNPIGLGQPLLINLWMQPPINVVRYYKAAFLVTFTKPDGTTSTVGPLDSFHGDTSAWFEYTVDQLGNWTVKFDFLGTYFPPGNYSNTVSDLSGTASQTTTTSFSKSVYYKPSSDGPYTFVVQQDLVASWPGSPLPTDYWTRPVSPENREWWPILGNYPATGIVGGGPGWPADTNTYMSNYLFTPYVQGPTSAHILWRRQDAIGGIVGGVWGQTYQPVSGTDPNIIYDGRCYQTVTKVIDGQTQSVWQCYDLQTGQIYWEKTGVQVPTFITYKLQQQANVPGSESVVRGNLAELVYVGGGRYIRYDPYTGAPTVNVSIAPLTTGTFYMDPYFLSVQSIGTTSNPNYRLINWTILGSVSGLNFANYALAVAGNISFPFSSLGTVDYESGIAVSTSGITPTGAGVAYGQRIMAASVTTGQVLWNITTDSTVGTQGAFSGSTAVADQGKYAVRLNDGHWHCWDLQTGATLWTSELSSWPWGTFGCYGVQSYGGMIISNQYDGVAAYNWTNGKLVWIFKAPALFAYETPYEGNYPWFTGVSIIADGKLYAYNTEHSPSSPITRGWKIFCINITTGTNIWNITGPMNPGSIADGYLEATNGYDGYMYFFGKGQSTTTVTAPDTAVPLGTAVTIRGTVMDTSPGDQGSVTNPTAPLNSPTKPGTVPCVSDTSMETQMEYLYMQLPIDGISHNATITGVQVTLTAIGSDGTVTNIGSVTTNGYYGTFTYKWTPPKEDTYTITASFAGDDSYGSSSAATGIAVSTAPTPTAMLTTPSAVVTTSDLMTYVVLAAVAIIIAIAIVGLAIIRILRKRP